jgi:hypothetical protein
MENEIFAKQSVEKEVKPEANNELYTRLAQERNRPETTTDSNKDTEEAINQTKSTIKKQIKTYTHEEVLKEATVYFKGDTLAAGVWMNKYALKNSRGKYLKNRPKRCIEG